MIDSNIESEVLKLKGLEAKVADLRKSNDDLQLEKLELAHRLDCVQILATSVLEDAEVSINLLLYPDSLVELCLSLTPDLQKPVSKTLIIRPVIFISQIMYRFNPQSEKVKEENQNLKKQIERLQADRCADVEQLVYLRWINACLRYELRNYQAGPGNTTARDLSKNLSPKSEEKVKQLILDYTNKLSACRISPENAVVSVFLIGFVFSGRQT